MAHVSITQDRLNVELTGLRRLWAFKRRIQVLLTHVRGATVDPGVFAEPKGVRSPGLHVPGMAALGSFRRDGEWTFWEARVGDRSVVIELRDERYTRLVLQVADPRAVVDQVNSAVAAVS